eukprot:TRINITY_DN104414_c0_g1_i1.p1 TRINITY_DN104414_c0_g1~~TRINITY_DN104414_c0_g1_i1.p1  ORF type:complete len:1062 (+),score=252.69 TRINITY_DN104414_c0_g1_i1:36-3188(+)
MAKVRQLMDMGFAQPEATLALKEVNGNVEQALELLLTGGLAEAEPEPIPHGPPGLIAGYGEAPNVAVEPSKGLAGGPSPEVLDAADTAALPSAVSLEDATQLALDASMSSLHMVRTPGLPCGLTNVGNTCYVNSLLQTLYHIDEFRDQMLSFRMPALPADTGQSGKEKRRQHALSLAAELHSLFAHCLLSQRSCLSPAGLLGELVDGRGQKVAVGSQEDVGEFMLKFFDQLDEGLKASIGVAAAGETDSATPSESLSLLQSMFFGEQNQIFSYCDSSETKATKDTQEGMEAGEGAEEGNKEELEAKEDHGKLVVNEEKSDFLQIFIDVKYGDLYSAWEAANCTEVEYTTPSGAKSSGTTKVWISRLPKFLFFQIQRVAYDPELKAQVKLEDKFDFDSTIYADRFLSSNRNTASDAQAKAQGLRQQISALERSLKNFERYAEGGEESAVSARTLLCQAAELLESNAKTLPAGEAATDKENWHPQRLFSSVCADDEKLDRGKVKEKLEELHGAESSESAVWLLRSMAELCQAREKQLKAEIASIEAQLDEAYKPLRKHPYELFAIWVHQSQQAEASSGHYVAYVKDWGRDRWVCFSDSQVSVVSWSEVMAAALGGERAKGSDKKPEEDVSRSSAYVLVYTESKVAEAQKSFACADSTDAVEGISSQIPEELLNAIRADNEVLHREQGSHQEQCEALELRRHAEAISQHYGLLLHKWEPQKRMGNQAGNPHDKCNHTKLNDPALVSFELFLYRLFQGEQEVWTYLLTQSVEAQRVARKWSPEDEGYVLHFLGTILKSQDCFHKMLRPKSLPDATGPAWRRMSSDLLKIDMALLSAAYNNVLVTAHVADEAVSLLKRDAGQLPRCLGMLAMMWSRCNLDTLYPYRQNEVLLAMSVIIYSTVGIVEKANQTFMKEKSLAMFRELFEFFYLLLRAVEWPGHWKVPLQERVLALFPKTEESLKHGVMLLLKERQQAQAQGVTPGVGFSLSVAEQKQLVFKHKMAQLDHRSIQDFEGQRPEPGREFFERHRGLLSWIMTDHETVAKEFILQTAGMTPS